MTRPDWCPQDVWDAASAALDGWTIDSGSVADFESCCAAVALAILAERNRCEAAILALPGMGDTDCCGGFERCRDDAIEAIRGNP